MAGAYCKFCDNRCFVYRVMPADARWMPGQGVHLATCVEGAAYDLEHSGYDHTTAINPMVEGGNEERLPYGSRSVSAVER